MARPSKTAVNVGVVSYNGHQRKVVALWDSTIGLYMLRLLEHGRPAGTISEARTIRTLKNKVPTFRLVQA